ncbi:hypothetical protein [Clostridium sp.]|uniref:hypothetical protein n=1 Tax=Clostridium sp. TaxID=1506 RepID=UPI0032178879
MQKKTEMQQGWEFAAKVVGADVAAHVGLDYVSKVAEAIEQLEKDINNHPYRGQDVAHFKGYVLEEYAAGTFNINAVAAGSSDKAQVLHSNELGSVDIQLQADGYTQDYSAKAYRSPQESGLAQAKLAADTREPLYGGQERLIPTDHLEGAKQDVHQRALRNEEIRPDVAAANRDTEKHLTDRISNKEGIKSNPVTQKELEDMARYGHEQNFNAEERGITLANVIKNEHLLKQSLEAGCTAAAITVAMQLAPELYKAIDYLIKHGEININHVKQMGSKAITASAEGFLRGSVSCSLYIICKEGLLGEAFRTVDPSLLGSVVAIVMETVKNSILVAAGKMTAKQMGEAFVDGIVISSGYLIGVKIGGAIGQALGFQLPVFGYLIGSLVGCAFATVYNIGKKKLISFCVDTGFTCFGLVEQNYELSDEVLKEIGIDTIKIDRTNVNTTEIKKTLPSDIVNRTSYETVNMTVLRRGVIGVNKIGYVL